MTTGSFIHVSAPCAPPQVTDDDPIRGCCYGDALRGPTHCTCWEVVVETGTQHAAKTDAEPIQRTKCCADCAYRVGSPEREAGEDLPAGDRPFWCHAGMPKAIGWRHPDGRWLPWEGDRDDYVPIVIDGVPYKWDGTPAEKCAGWRAAAA